MLGYRRHEMASMMKMMILNVSSCIRFPPYYDRINLLLQLLALAKHFISPLCRQFFYILHSMAFLTV